MESHSSTARPEPNDFCFEGEAFLKMADDPEGAKVLASSAELLKQTSPLAFIAAKDSEFANMRRFYRTAVVKVELQ